MAYKVGGKCGRNILTLPLMSTSYHFFSLSQNKNKKKNIVVVVFVVFDDTVCFSSKMPWIWMSHSSSYIDYRLHITSTDVSKATSNSIHNVPLNDLWVCFGLHASVCVCVVYAGGWPWSYKLIPNDSGCYSVPLCRCFFSTIRSLCYASRTRRYIFQMIYLQTMKKSTKHRYHLNVLQMGFFLASLSTTFSI